MLGAATENRRLPNIVLQWSRLLSRTKNRDGPASKIYQNKVYILPELQTWKLVHL